VVSADVIQPVAVPAVDPDRQAAAVRLARSLASDGAEPTLHVAIERAPRPGCWFLSADGPAIRVDVVDGRAAALHPDRADAAVAALDALEPLLDRIEALTGWVMEPEATAAEAPADAILLRLEVGGTRFALAVPPALWSVADAAAPGAALARVPLPARLGAVAAHLSVEDAGALAPGDLLVLHPAPWAGVLGVAPAGDLAVVYDPVTGAVASGRLDGGDGVAEGVEGVRGFRVPVEIRLEGASATLEELAALREGGTLALGPLTAGLRVDLTVGGRPIANGEVVRLGDRYAVLVERVASDGAA
jgi:hypothetical protein